MKFVPKLEDEPELEISRIICLDGNNSLKRMRPANDRQAASTRTLDDTQYFLSRNDVDRFSKEVKGRQRKGPAVRSGDEDASEQSDDDLDLDLDLDLEPEGDPTDGATSETGSGDDGGVESDRAKAIKACTTNWKAAQADEVKRMWDNFDESGIFASACRHGMVLVLADMVMSGEL